MLHVMNWVKLIIFFSIIRLSLSNPSEDYPELSQITRNISKLLCEPETTKEFTKCWSKMPQAQSQKGGFVSPHEIENTCRLVNWKID